MATTSTQKRRVDLIPNVPVQMHLRYIDAYPNDPSKDPKGKGFGASLKLTGTVDGEDAICYPKGALWANLKALVAAGVILQDDYNDDPPARYSIPVQIADVTLCRQQLAGERYPSLIVQAVGAQVRTSVAAPSKKPQTEPVALGYVPGLDSNQQETTGAPPPMAAPTARLARTRESVRDELLACIELAVPIANLIKSAGYAVTGDTLKELGTTVFIECNRGGIR